MDVYTFVFHMHSHDRCGACCIFHDVLACVLALEDAYVLDVCLSICKPAGPKKSDLMGK